MNYLDLDSVVAEAMTIVKEPAKYENVARQWCYTAMMELGASDDEIEVCELVPKNLLVKKPDECRQLIDMQMYDIAGNEICFTFRAGKKRIHKWMDAPVDVSEDRTYIYIGTTGTNVAKVKLRFFSYPLDSNGLPMVREDEKLALIYYIRFMIALFDDDNMSKIQMDEMRWKMEADRVRAKKKASDFSEVRTKTMKRNWLRMIPVFNKNLF